MSLLDDLKKYVKEEDEIAQPGAGIDIRFNNLDSVTQKKIMEAVMEDLNVDADDEFANKKIVDCDLMLNFIFSSVRFRPGATHRKGSPLNVNKVFF